MKKKQISIFGILVALLLFIVAFSYAAKNISEVHVFLYKKLGSAPSTKSFLVS